MDFTYPLLDLAQLGQVIFPFFFYVAFDVVVCRYFYLSMLTSFLLLSFVFYPLSSGVLSSMPLSFDFEDDGLARGYEVVC